jgi:hypothetical protein
LAEKSGYESIALPLVDNETLDLTMPPQYGSKTKRRQELAFVIIKAAFSQARNFKKIKNNLQPPPPYLNRWIG